MTPHDRALSFILDARLRSAGSEPAWYTKRHPAIRRADDLIPVDLDARLESPIRKIHCLARTGRISEAEFDAFWRDYDADAPD